MFKHRFAVMVGLDPTIHVFSARITKAWVLATSARMTGRGAP
jgi:hypothetical protein